MSEEFAIFLFYVVATPVGVYAVGVDVAAVNSDSVWRESLSVNTDDVAAAAVNTGSVVLVGLLL